jgi:iron complex transport system substrate-binding protein
MHPTSLRTADRQSRRGDYRAWLLSSAALLAPLLAGAAPWSVRDDDGRTLTLSAPAQRIVSLSPGATALLFAAGAGAQIVGTSEYSVEPDAARNIPRVGDSQSFDSELILSLHPDVVIAWVDGTPEAQIARIERLGIPVYRHHVQRLDDLAVSIRRLGQLAGTEAAAQASAAALERQLHDIRSQFHSEHPPSILIQIWQSPVYTVGAGQMLSDALASCGYRNLYGDLSAASPAVTLESVLARAPEVILALAPDDAAAAEWLAQWRRFPAIPAVADGRLVGFSDQALSRLGPATVSATAALCTSLKAAEAPRAGAVVVPRGGA